MAGVIVALVAITVTVVSGVCIGAFIRLSLAIRSEDRMKWSLRLDAPSASAKAARSLIGVSESGW